MRPKKIKYGKSHKRISKGYENNLTCLNRGTFGIKVLECGRITAKQLNAIKLTLTKKMKKVGKIWLNCFPDLPITKKPSEIRMGKGKGNVEFWCFPVKSGRIIIEITGVSHILAKEALLLAKFKLPLKSRIIKNLVR